MNLPVLRDDNFKEIFTKVNSYPKLSKEEEFDLYRRYKENNDTQALNFLISCSTRYVFMNAWKYRFHKAFKDIIQEGLLGLVTATKKFDLDKNKKFSDYATIWIRAYMYDCLISNSTLLTAGKTRSYRQLFANMDKVIKKFLKEKQQATDEEIILHLAQELDISIDDVRSSYYLLMNANMIELDNIIDKENLEINLIESDYKEYQQKTMYEAYQYLTDREKEVIKLRYFTDPSLSLVEIGKELNISKQRVAMLEKNAIDKMKNFLGGQHEG